MNMMMKKVGEVIIAPKSWVLEVPNDGSEGSWNVVDFRNNNFDPNPSRPHVRRLVASARRAPRPSTFA